MRVYKVSPMLKYSPFFELTYISKLDFSPGNIVEIDFNRQKILGIILECFDLKDVKVEIRKSDFFTKKIETKLDKKSLEKFSQKQFKALQNFSHEFGISLGEIIFYLFGNEVNLENNVFASLGGGEAAALNSHPDFNFEKYLLLTSPHISRLHLFFIWLEFFNDSKYPKQVFETSFLGLNERYFLENLKKENPKIYKKIEIIESEHKAKKFLVNVDYEEIINQEVLDMLYPPTGSGGKQSVFIFVLEQAYASRVFCNDCKESFNCENCSQAYSVIHEKDEMYLFCKNCKNKKILKKDQYLICRKCGSWKVLPFGNGVQKVKEFLKEKGLEMSIGSIKELNKFLLKKKVFDITVVASFGPLVKGKNFDSDEKLIYLISKLENISKEIYINKRKGDEISLENYKNKEKFIEEELKFRKTANLPPYKKVVSLIFNYRAKRAVDKFLLEDVENYKISGEIKKGNTYIYYWFKNDVYNFCKILRNFGDVVVSNSIVEQSFSLKK